MQAFGRTFDQEALRLLRAFFKIREPGRRRILIELAEELTDDRFQATSIAPTARNNRSED